MGIRKEVRLEEIATEVGVSVVTVSNALNGRKGVSNKLRSKIFETAEKMGYEIVENKDNEIKVKRIGVVVAERYMVEYQSFYMEIYRNIVNVADGKQCLTILEVVDVRKEQLLEKKSSFLEFNIDGIIVLGKLESEYISWLKKTCKVPFVCVDFYNTDKAFDYFVIDGYTGTFLLTKKLINLGHKDIAFIGTPRANISIMDRYMGYLKALRSHGIKEDKSRLIYDRNENQLDGEVDFALPAKLPTAFVCNCDLVALKLIEKLEKIGVRVPEDVSVVGFDNYCYKKIEGVQLTTFEYDPKALAQASVNTLIRRIEKGNEPKGIQIINGKIIEGNTVKEI